MNPAGESKSGQNLQLGRRCYIGEFVIPQVKWVENASCPICDGEELIETGNFALCISCNKFVRPKRTS